MADLGFSAYKFKTVLLHYTPSMDDDKMYCLNQSTWELRYHPLENFTMTEWKPVVDRVNDMYAQIALSLMICCYARSRNGLLWGIGVTS